MRLRPPPKNASRQAPRARRHVRPDRTLRRGGAHGAARADGRRATRGVPRGARRGRRLCQRPTRSISIRVSRFCNSYLGLSFPVSNLETIDSVLESHETARVRFEALEIFVTRRQSPTTLSLSLSLSKRNPKSILSLGTQVFAPDAAVAKGGEFGLASPAGVVFVCRRAPL